MLAGLRHDAFVGRDDQQHGVDSTDAGQHVLDEAFVPGHVYERHVVPSDPGVRKPEVDRDPACLFLLQTIGIRAGEREDKRTLAVIDVTGCTEDDRLHVAKASLTNGTWIPAVRAVRVAARACPPSSRPLSSAWRGSCADHDCARPRARGRESPRIPDRPVGAPCRP